VPPTIFGDVVEQISSSCRALEPGFTRLMIEKPFGRDSASFDALDALTARHFDEAQLFRLDHYLGKEIVLNIPTLRWANAMFEPLWSRAHVESVQITFKENLGTEGRGGYFDGFGIVRDIIQNHLLQVQNVMQM
jgi:glucose-6-phosphate 1-dehydrogenase